MLQLVTLTSTNFGLEPLDQLRDLCPLLTVSKSRHTSVSNKQVLVQSLDAGITFIVFDTPPEEPPRISAYRPVPYISRN